MSPAFALVAFVPEVNRSGAWLVDPAANTLAVSNKNFPVPEAPVLVTPSIVG
jgi:hypothetical protein